MKFYDRIIALFEADFAKTKEWIEGDALPFMENLLKTIEEDAVTELKPFAEQALGIVLQDAGVLLTGGGWGAVVASAVPELLKLLEAAGRSVEKIAGADLITALSAAAANAQAAAVAPKPAA